LKKLFSILLIGYDFLTVNSGNTWKIMAAPEFLWKLYFFHYTKEKHIKLFQLLIIRSVQLFAFWLIIRSVQLFAFEILIFLFCFPRWYWKYKIICWTDFWNIGRDHIFYLLYRIAVKLLLWESLYFQAMFTFWTELIWVFFFFATWVL